MADEVSEQTTAEISNARTSNGPSSGRPQVSIVVAAYNAALTLGDCIDTLLEQTYPSTELIVVDDGSTDDTPAILAQHPRRDRFVARRLTNGGPSRARNFGITLAQGDLIVFFDADLKAHPRCVEELVGALEGEGVVSVGGIQRSPDDESEFGKEVQKYFETVGFLTGYSQSGKGEGVFETAHNPSCNVLYRRQALEEIGGFDEGLWPGEDVDLDRRLSLEGFCHLFQERAIVYHYRPTDLEAYRRMMYSYGRVQWLLVKRYGFFRHLHFVPLVSVVWIVAVIAGILFFPRIGAIVTVACLALALALAEYRRSRSRQGLRFYSLLCSNVVFWHAGFFAELFRPKYEVSLRLPRSVEKA